MFPVKVTNAEGEVAEQLRSREKELEQTFSRSQEARVVEPIYVVKKKWYDAEIFKRSNVTIIHVFPNKRGLLDDDFMHKTWYAIDDAVKKNITHLHFKEEWIDEVDSFCISYLSTPDSIYIGKKLLEDFYNGLYKRLV